MILDGTPFSNRMDMTWRKFLIEVVVTLEFIKKYFELNLASM